MPKVKPIRSRWFDLPDDPLKGRVHVRLLKKAEVQAIVAQGIDSKTIDKGFDDKGERLCETEIRVDNGKTAKLLAVACVLGWENFLDEKDQPLECTPENIKLFILEDGFAAFLKDCREVLAKEAADAEEEARKNLKALGSGSPA